MDRDVVSCRYVKAITSVDLHEQRQIVRKTFLIPSAERCSFPMKAQQFVALFLIRQIVASGGLIPSIMSASSSSLNLYERLERSCDTLMSYEFADLLIIRLVDTTFDGLALVCEVSLDEVKIILKLQLRYNICRNGPYREYPASSHSHCHRRQHY